MSKAKDFAISPEVTLPCELATRRSAIFGISGSGKSNTATVCIEGLLAAGEQVVLIDPKGEGWGLQTSANGKSEGFDVIVFGQPRGDVPELREEHAEQIADFVVDSGRSVVLSLLGFDSDKSERRFVTRFFQRLYRRKSQMSVKTRTLVVIEEAHLFLPEQASGGDAEMVGAIKRIARQGRSAGLGLMIVDQRPQDVAKSIISQCELLICHQLTHKLDRAALTDWVKAYDRKGEGETFLASLAELPPGEGWLWSPAWLHLFLRTKFDRRHTYDSGATPDGSSAAAPKARAKVNLDALRTQMAKIVEETKANDPAELKKAIAAKQKEIDQLTRAAATPAAAPQREKVKIVEKPVITDAQIARLEKIDATNGERLTQIEARIGKLAAPLEKALRDAQAKASDLLNQFYERVRTLSGPTEKVLRESQAKTSELLATARAIQALPDPSLENTTRGHNLAGAGASAPAGHTTKPASVPQRVAPAAAGGTAVGGRTVDTGPGDVDSTVSGAMRRMMIAIAQRPGMTKNQIAVRAGMAVTGGSFRTYLSKMRVQGWLIDNEGRSSLTEDGVRVLGTYEPLPEGRALLNYWVNELGNSGASRILSALANAYPNPLDNEAIAAATGMATTGGSFRTYMSKLRVLELVTPVGKGLTKASDELCDGEGLR